MSAMILRAGGRRAWRRPALEAPARKALVTAVALTALALALLALTAGPASASQDDYDKAYALGLEAYTYGLPLLTTNATFLTMTSVNVSSGAFGPVNQFNSVRSVNNPGSTTVVAPGSNGLSSIAWLDLRAEPQVLHVPVIRGHFFVLGFIDPYTRISST